MISANSILQIVTLAVVGWMLKEIISLKEAVAALKQQIKDKK